VSELTKRVLFALIAAPVFLGLLWIGGWPFIVMMVIITLIIQWEMSGMFEIGETRPSRPFMYMIGLWVMLIPYFPYEHLLGLGLFLLLVASEIIRGPARSYNSMVNTIFCGLYAPVGMLTLIRLREHSFGLNDEHAMAGFLLAGALMMMVWGNDVFAYFIGKNFGKHLLAPKISPKKTWEGFGGGILGAFTGLGIVMMAAPAFPLSGLQMLPAVLLVSFFGPIGDLAASKLKRLYGAKDSSNILPGHGGFFDRFDALLLAAPATYLYLELLRITGLL
jgi:phosphatidate cytidylyltransferase